MDKTKEKIIIAARIAFAQKGYSKATIKEIAEQADVARGLLHYHFKNKDDLLIHVMKSIYEESISPTALDEMGAATPEELAATATFVLREALKSTPEFFELIYGTLNIIRQSQSVRNALVEIWSEHRKEAEESIVRLKKKGAIHSSLDPSTLLTLLISVLHGIGIQVIGEPHLKLTESEELWLAIKKNLLYLFGNS